MPKYLLDCLKYSRCMQPQWHMHFQNRARKLPWYLTHATGSWNIHQPPVSRENLMRISPVNFGAGSGCGPQIKDRAHKLVPPTKWQ